MNTAENIQPKFPKDKTYQGRRGRRMYRVTGIITTEPGKHQYNVIELPSQTPKLYSEKTMLEIARVLAKTDNRVHLSASQIDTFMRCKRKWAFVYIDGEFEPSTIAQEFGTEVHAVLEHYLNFGTWEGAVDAVGCARQGEGILPAPCDPNLGVEESFTMVLPSLNAVIVGYIDLIVPPYSGMVEVSDHKTTKDLRYAKTEEQLRTDVQANIYSKHTMDEFKCDVVLARWRNYCARPTKKKGSVNGRPRNLRGFSTSERIKTRAEVDEQWEILMPVVAEMVKLSKDQSITAKDVECDELACGDYGGCYFGPRKTKLCSVTRSSLGALMEHSKVAHLKGAPKGTGQKMSLMDIINANKNKEAAPATAAPAAAAAPAPAAAAAAAPMSALERAAQRSLAARQKAEGATGVNPPPVEAAPLDPELQAATEKPIPESWKTRFAKGHKARNEDEKKWRADMTAAMVEASGKTSDAPAAAPTPEPVKAEPAPTPEPNAEQLAREQAWKAGQKALAEAAANTRALDEPVQVHHTLPGKVETTVVPPGALAGIVETTPAHVAAAPVVEEGFNPDDGLFILMIDCVPMKGASKLFGMTTLAEELHDLKEVVQKMLGVPHWNMPEFRKGANTLAACAETQYRTEGTPVGIVLCDSGSREWDAVGGVLIELADVVIRG